MWPVVLSGGSGTRLWPLSRSMYPKQLLPLVGEHSMLSDTVSRTANRDVFEAPLIIANENHRFIIAEQMRDAKQNATIILEPEGRNTAPAIALAAEHIAGSDPEALMLVMPSDHVIADEAAFGEAVTIAAGICRGSETLVTFGIKPEGPETGYGYIEASATGRASTSYKVKRFTEKPDQKTAEEFIKSGNFYWNAGIFMFSAAAYLKALQKFQPDMKSAVAEAMNAAQTDLDFIRPEAEAFRRAPSDSIDYAVIEKTDKATVVPVNMGWSDLGSWSALWEISEKDANGNALSGDALLHETQNSLVRVEAGGPAVAAVGVDGLIITSTADAVLVTAKDKAQDVKFIVDQLKAAGREEHMFHHVVYRPWGSYQTTDLGERFQTKRLVVKPGAELSLQKHHHRAEHWIVVQGTAKVTRGEDVITLYENQSTYIPMGTKHRLENPGKIPLHIIEVQSGSYLGEDDIIRFEDHYGRV
ncbi:MAG: mannose-1-phosphate guanylyltransferase/mannose-6-phosphate isomerase [Pseudomonadota bacterium]